MPVATPRTDDELLSSEDPEAFGGRRAGGSLGVRDRRAAPGRLPAPGAGRAADAALASAAGSKLARAACGCSRTGHSGDLERIDPETFQRTAYVPRNDGERLTQGVSSGLAVSGRSVWTRQRRSVFEIDGGSGRVVSRVDGISPTQAYDTARTLLADPDGVWVVGQTNGVLYRVEGGRIIQRIAVGATAGVVARVGSTVWVSAARGPDGGNQLVRIDPDEGKVTQRIGFGYDVPQALVPVGKDLWVITSGGEAKLVSPE